MLQLRSAQPSFRLLLCCAALLLRWRAVGQTATPDANGNLVFKANGRTVIIDVVVTGHNGKAIEGLHQEDFELAEDGHAQQLAFFEEHKGPQSVAASLPDLPPNIFTNIPRVKPAAAVTVLLLDSLNTPTGDQSVMHAQILKCLASVKPGRRIAIFTLGNRLRFIQGFTSDPAVLVAALNRPKSGTGPQASPLLRSNAQDTAEQTALAQIAEAQQANPSPALEEALQRLQQFQAEEATFQNDQRMRMTLDALQQLGRYLAGIPGRKNVIWFSGAFPLTLLPNAELSDSFSVQREYGALVRKTDDLLAAAEVAIYPIAAEGLATDKFFAADQVATGFTSASQPGQPAPPTVQPIQQQALNSEVGHLNSGTLERNADHTTMEQIAKETGGEAFFNTNGLNDALDRVADHGSSFYTLAFTPSNGSADGRFRKLQVKLLKGADGGGARLAYRRGYYAFGAPASQTAIKPSSDPLHPFMGPGMPESTQILFAMRIKPGGEVPLSGADPSPELVKHSTPTFDSNGRIRALVHTDVEPGEPGYVAVHAGDNPKLKGKLTRYSVDFVIAARGLQLEPTPNGGRRGSIESTLVVYDREGRPVNWLVRQLDLSMDAARYEQVRANGINFRLDIDVPKDGVSLRSGIYDLSSDLAGTTEVSLDRVLVGRAPGLKAR